MTFLTYVPRSTNVKQAICYYSRPYDDGRPVAYSHGGHVPTCPPCPGRVGSWDSRRSEVFFLGGEMEDRLGNKPA